MNIYFYVPIIAAFGISFGGGGEQNEFPAYWGEANSYQNHTMNLKGQTSPTPPPLLDAALPIPNQPA